MSDTSLDKMNDGPRSGSRSVTLWMLVVFVVPVIVFGQSLAFDFVNFDDNRYVYDNPKVLDGLSLDGARWAFTSAHYQNYHPITWLSHMLDHELFGLAPGRHHGMSVFIHAMNSVLLFLLLRAWTGAVGKSAVVALLFAVHPLHVESVAWISQRKDTLSTFLLLITLGVYTQYIRRATLSRYLVVLLLFAATLLAKPALIVLPALLMLLDYWPLNRFNRVANPATSVPRLLLEKIPLAAIATAVAFVAYVLLKQAGAAAWASPYPATVRLANAIVACAVSLGKTVWPSNLVPFYPHAGTMAPWPQFVAAMATLTLVTVIAVRYRAAHPFFLVGWGWFLISFLPNSGVFYARLYAHADRHSYVPLIGVFIIVAWGAPLIAARRVLSGRALSGATAVAVAFFALMAYVQASHWRNSETLWRYTIETTPRNALAYQNLGVFYLANAMLGESEAALKQAVECSESLPHARASIGGRSLNALGGIAAARGDYEAACQHYARAVELLPGDAGVRTNFGEALVAAGRPREAAEELRHATSLDPDQPNVWNSLAFTLVLLGQSDEAFKAASRAAELNTNDAQSRYHMALAEFMAERYDSALAYIEEALEIDERHEEARNLKTEILSRRGIDPEDVPLLDAP